VTKPQIMSEVKELRHKLILHPMSRKYIGKFLSFKFVGRKHNISGVVLDYNDDYTLIRSCTDYMLDGYIVFRNLKVEYFQGDYEKRATKILKLKKYSFKESLKISLESLDQIFSYINKKYGLIQLDNRKGDASDVLRYLGQSDEVYLFDELTVDAKWRYKLRLPEKECRFICFGNDYLKSLKLLAR
jgi:hypothetical protein